MEESPAARSVSPENVPKQSPNVQVGGTIDAPAFALLDGVAYGKNLDPTDCTKIKVPLTRIPATLGRDHETPDESFFGLGPKKALSREQCRIYFQEPNGGRFVFRDDKFVYEPHKGKKRVVIPLDENEPLPEEGFFCIECVGKNKIIVGHNRVEQGQVAQLKSGTPIRISTVCLFFLLPTDSPPGETMEIPALQKKKKRAAPKASNGDQGAAKRQATSGGPYAAVLQEFENKSVEELLAEMREAIDSDVWERRHQLMGGVLALHAVKDASRSKRIRAEVRETGGVSRKTIMDWMAASSKYAFWVRHLLSRVEVSSYQTTVTKALQKAGYERQGKHGRFVKWTLPSSTANESEVSDEEEEGVDSSSDDGSDSGGESDKDVKMAGVNEEEDEDEDSSDDDDDDENADDSAIGAETKSDNAGESNASSDNDDAESSADDNVAATPKPSEGGSAGSNDEDNDSDDDSSDDEKARWSNKGDEKMEDVQATTDGKGEDEEGAGSSGSDLMADADENENEP